MIWEVSEVGIEPVRKGIPRHQSPDMGVENHALDDVKDFATSAFGFAEKDEA